VPRAQRIFSGSSAHRTVALTFDDGWDPDRCAAIADTLTTFEVPATWFPNGVYVRRAKAVWRSIADRFPIGNHTYFHSSLPDIRSSRVRREIEHNEQVIERITGHPMVKLLRPPYGASDKRVEQIAAELGYPHIVLWDTSDADTAPHVTARGAAKAALRGGPGSIVLMHCGPEVTPEILPVVIARYACDGYRFATVEELMAGDPGHAAKVDCPPPPLPAPEKRRPRRSPDPSPGPDPNDPSPSPEPTASPPSIPVEALGTWTVVAVSLSVEDGSLTPLRVPVRLFVGASGVVAVGPGCLVVGAPGTGRAALSLVPWAPACQDGDGARLLAAVASAAEVVVQDGLLSFLDPGGRIVLSAVAATD